MRLHKSALFLHEAVNPLDSHTLLQLGPGSSLSMGWFLVTRVEVEVDDVVSVVGVVDGAGLVVVVDVGSGMVVCVGFVVVGG